jgi:hypothetical protein
MLSVVDFLTAMEFAAHKAATPASAAAEESATATDGER